MRNVYFKQYFIYLSIQISNIYVKLPLHDLLIVFQHVHHKQQNFFFLTKKTTKIHFNFFFSEKKKDNYIIIYNAD